jgi:hypothetical protein
MGNGELRPVSKVEFLPISVSVNYIQQNPGFKYFDNVALTELRGIKPFKTSVSPE